MLTNILTNYTQVIKFQQQTEHKIELFLRIRQNSCSRQIEKIAFFAPEHLQIELNYIKKIIYATTVAQHEISIFYDQQDHLTCKKNLHKLFQLDLLSVVGSVNSIHNFNPFKLTKLNLIFLTNDNLNSWHDLLEKLPMQIHIIRHEGDFLVNGPLAACDCDNCLLTALLDRSAKNFQLNSIAPMDYTAGKQYSMLTYKKSNQPTIAPATVPASYFCKINPLTTIKYQATPATPAKDPYSFYTASHHPKYIAAPMVGQSDLAFRMMTRAHKAEMSYTPMINAELFLQNQEYCNELFTTCLKDDPLIPQFAANDPEILTLAIIKILNIATKANCLTNIKYIGLNLGCPQNIGRRHKIGAWTMENWELLKKLIISANNILRELAIGIECKIRIFDSLKYTLAYCQMLQNSGCSLLTVHGRLRSDTKNQNPADWQIMKLIKQQLTIPVIANGGITDLATANSCLAQTTCDGVMAASSLLTNPYLFEPELAKPTPPLIALEYLNYVDQYGSPPLTYIKSHILQFFSGVDGYDQASSELLHKIKNFNKIEQLKTWLEIARNMPFQTSGNSYQDHFQAVFLGHTKPKAELNLS